MMKKQAELKKQAYASDLKSRALSVLIYLIDRSNKDLTCFPAIPTMAEQLHISVSTVKRALHELVQAGFIKKESRFRDKNRGQTSNLYTLILRNNTPDKPENESKPEEKEQMSISAQEEHSEPESKAENLTANSVKYITFADLKEKTVQVEENMELSTGETESTAFYVETPKSSVKTVEKSINTNPDKRCAPDQALCFMNLRLTKHRYKICGTISLAIRQQKQLVSYWWTGEGFNLQPP